MSIYYINIHLHTVSYNSASFLKYFAKVVFFFLSLLHTCSMHSSALRHVCEKFPLLFVMISLNMKLSSFFWCRRL